MKRINASMNKQRIITAAISLLILSGCTKDFQSSNWGDSMEKVKLSESKQEWISSDSPDGNQSAIYYEGQVENLPAVIFFAFSNDELVWGRYVFLEQHTDHAKYYSDCTVINNALQKKLGSVDVQYVFSADTHKQTPEQWGESIYQGDLLVQTDWENNRSEVMHVIFGEIGGVSHAVEYQSIQAGN